MQVGFVHNRFYLVVGGKKPSYYAVPSGTSLAVDVHGDFSDALPMGTSRGAGVGRHWAVVLFKCTSLAT